MRSRSAAGIVSRIECANDPDIEAEFPRFMAGSATVTTRSGETLKQKTVIAKGEPENFLSDGELRSKFDGLTSPWLSESIRDDVAQKALSMSELGNINELTSLAKSSAKPALAAVASSGSDD